MPGLGVYTASQATVHQKERVTVCQRPVEEVHPYLPARTQRRSVDLLAGNAVQPGGHLWKTDCLVLLGDIERCRSGLGDEQVPSVKSSARYASRTLLSRYRVLVLLQEKAIRRADRL
jgi:hypothetical protein